MEQAKSAQNAYKLTGGDSNEIMESKN